MFERFTDRARKVMALANQEAQRFHHEYIGTQHLLLGLVKEGGGVGATILKNLDVDLKKLQIEMEKLTKPEPDIGVMEKLPNTPRARKVIEYAIEEASALNHKYVGTEHILLGLLRETEGVAAKILMNIGIKLEDVRQEVLLLLGAGIEKTDVEKDSSSQGPFAEGDDFRDDDWQKDFRRFLTEEKGWSEIHFENEKYKTMSIDLSIRHPESKKLIAVIDFKESIDRKIESKAKALFAQFAELELGRYLVTPSTGKSNYSFAIYKYSDRGLVRMQPNDFPAYEEYYPKTPDKKLTLFKFKIGVDLVGGEICDKIIDLAGDSNIGLYAEDVDEGYVNLRLEGSKKTDNVAVQIHKYGEYEATIALAIVGVEKGKKNIEPTASGFIDKGRITELSGYKKKIPGEIAWLNGNLPKKNSREKSQVYLIQREILEVPGEWKRVEELLEIGVNNIVTFPPKESEKPKIEPEAEEMGPYHAPIAAFSGDGVRDGEGRLVDQLGIEPEVNAMSSLVAACDIKWPLSIGLFGDWGSGKSFFMEKMYDRIKKTSEESRKWVGAGNESAYCTNVVQIRFNAWHYMDANLWASLVTHIFEELARQMSGDKEEDLARTKEKLFGQLESAKELKREAQEKESRAAELKEKAQEKLSQVEKEKEVAAQELADLTARDVIALAIKDPRVKGEFADITDKLGLGKITLAADDLRTVVLEAQDLFGRVSLIWKTIASRRTGKIKLLGAIGLILGLPVLVGLVAWWVSDSAFAAQLTGVIGMIGSVITGHMKALKPRLAGISKGLAQWEKAQEEILKIGAEKTQQRTEEELRILREIENLRERERAAEEDVERAERLEDEASEELEEIKTGRRLFRFIEERSRKSEYKEKLGIIALIREDFELLSKLVSKSSEEAAGDDLPRVDRIVLFIDDLDRCPSERVVEVLQAVHLILAFELFVVVVAVDSRWILHALYEEYSAFGGVDKVSARVGSRWLTTPQNYVEKIFQIPFALRPMGNRGYRQLVGKLVESEGRKEGKVPALEDKEKQEPDREIPQREVKEIQAEEPGDRVEGEKDKPDEFEPTIEMKPPSANLSEQEAEFMKAMGDLIPSPRAAKRFVNIYRLTLASVDDGGKLSELRGTENGPGDYQAVLLMLAILTGFPGQGADILKTLVNGDRKFGGIMDFVSKLKTRKEPNSEPARYRNGVRKGILEAERAVWDRLSNILKEKIKELGVRDSLEPFVRWAGWVARFSFQYKPVISEEERAGEDG